MKINARISDDQSFIEKKIRYFEELLFAFFLKTSSCRDPSSSSSMSEVFKFSKDFRFFVLQLSSENNRINFI